MLKNNLEEKFSSIQEIEQAIQESEIQQEDENKIENLSFDGYKNSKHQITEQRTESIGTSQIGIKQKDCKFPSRQKHY